MSDGKLVSSNWACSGLTDASLGAIVQVFNTVDVNAIVTAVVL